ncbi:MAG: hypothetical protein ACRDS0_21180 [Pseudonocardiaceae bacterium]
MVPAVTISQLTPWLWLLILLGIGIVISLAVRARHGQKWVRGHVRAVPGAASGPVVEVMESRTDYSPPSSPRFMHLESHVDGGTQVLEVGRSDLTGPFSARVFLLDDATETVETLTRSFGDCGVAQPSIHGLRSLSGLALRAVDRKIATVTDGLLNLDFGNLLMSGWRKYTELTTAAHRTLAAPGREEHVVLATHRVVSTHHPSVDLLVDDVKVHTFDFELKVVFDLNGVTAVLRQGDLVALRGGDCMVTATLILEGTPLELSRKGRIDLALVIELRWPIPLARQDRHPPTSHFDRPAPTR